jgi:hypothetical protein
MPPGWRFFMSAEALERAYFSRCPREITAMVDKGEQVCLATWFWAGSNGDKS